MIIHRIYAQSSEISIADSIVSFCRQCEQIARKSKIQEELFRHVYRKEILLPCPKTNVQQIKLQIRGEIIHLAQFFQEIVNICIRVQWRNQRIGIFTRTVENNIIIIYRSIDGQHDRRRQLSEQRCQQTTHIKFAVRCLCRIDSRRLR